MGVRLPQTGSDDGTWGDILNDFLLQSHNSDGTLKPLTQDQIVSLVADLASKYERPVNGIPETDLATEVAAKLNAASPIESVAGKTGAVTLAKADVGLSNVDNTSDASKPVSAAMQTALDLKADTADLATKASQSALDALTATVQTKADESEVTTLTTTVSTKADATDLASLSATVQTKADEADLEALAATVAAKTDLTSLAPVATSGQYTDLTGTPALSPVATSGLYGDLTGKPTLATVATTGSYTDLANKPVIPATAADVGAVSTSGLDAATASLVTGPSSTNTNLLSVLGAQGTAASTPSALVRRDASGNATFANISADNAPSAASHLTRKDYVDAKTKQVFFTAHNGTGSGGITAFSFANTFTTIALPTVDADTNSAFSTATNIYTVPVGGYYDIKALIRVKDGDSVGANIGIGVGTSLADSATFAWYPVVSSAGSSTSRNSYFYALTAHYNVGDQVRLFGYADKTATPSTVSFAGASLSMVLLSAG